MVQTDQTGVPLIYRECVPDGERVERLGVVGLVKHTVLCTCMGLAGRGEILAYPLLLLQASGYADLRELLRNNWVAAAVLLSTSALSALSYYSCCLKMKTHYYVDNRDKADSWKCQPTKWLASDREKEEVRYGILNAACGGFYAVTMGLASLRGGYTKLYYDVNQYGMVYFLLSFPLLFHFIECFAYWIHRFWHLKFVYARFHKMHHKFQPPTPFSALAFHPFEWFVYVIGGQTFFWVVPCHPIPAVVVGLYTSYHLIEDHSGVKMTSVFPWQPTTMYHDDHHQYFHVNFGQHIVFWDWLCGTLRQPGRTYTEETFGGHGAGKKVS
eukprot:CAMPEP_0204345800 /NCGR_PEP_ID=MMETSP0469-20131031/26675_1 /ASSEMBLY_ACC=CAM_ASM_000384 /TAXON_ID=2969 /ORGANISM="Oxyrrhis marina" /LENGTH=325 /DNA_ID=CAMNT_0051331303 /DNA_START=36 /DNA_END=1013 /DNA_ORIENTATION=-